MTVAPKTEYAIQSSSANAAPKSINQPLASAMSVPRPPTVLDRTMMVRGLIASSERVECTMASADISAINAK